MKNARSIRYTKALKEWDALKIRLNDQVERGEITEKERLEILRREADRLDI